MQQELKFFAENRYTIERLRTEKEVIAFFAKNKIFIDKNFTKQLKLKYKANNSSKLNSFQLEKVAGGGPCSKAFMECYRHSQVISTEDNLFMQNMAVPEATQTGQNSPTHGTEIPTHELPVGSSTPLRRSDLTNLVGTDSTSSDRNNGSGTFRVVIPFELD